MNNRAGCSERCNYDNYRLAARYGEIDLSQVERVERYTGSWLWAIYPRFDAEVVIQDRGMPVEPGS